MINTGNSQYKNQHWIIMTCIGGWLQKYNKHNSKLMHGVV